MSAIQAIMLTANFVAFPLLMWRGGRWDRWAAAACVAAPLASSALAGLAWGGFYIGIYVVDLLFFLSLWFLAERAGRWWIVLAAGSQLIGLLGHFGPVLAHQRLDWAFFTLMWAVWGLISLTALFGVWEVEADRRFALGGRNGTTMDDGDGARPAPSME